MLIKLFFIKKTCNVVFQSSKNEEITLLHVFIFVFIWYFIGAILSRKSCQKQGVQKKDKKEGWPYEGGCLQKGGFKHSAYYEYFLFLFCYLKKGHALFLRYFSFYKILLNLNLNIDSMKGDNRSLQWPIISFLIFLFFFFPLTKYLIFFYVFYVQSMYRIYIKQYMSYINFVSCVVLFYYFYF